VTRSPTPQRLPLAPQYPKRVRPKTYTVAVYLVGAIFALQAGMVISVFWLRAMVVSVNVQVPKARVTVAPPVKPAEPISRTGPVLPRLPGLEATPQSAILSVPTISSKQEQVANLNDEAQVLLHQNDLKNAAKVLQNAEDLDPRNPTTLKNLAETYYLLNDSVAARNYWQRIADLGPGVGTVYALAKDHVLLLNSEANTLAQSSPFPRGVYIDEVQKTPVETVNGQPQFRLRPVLVRKNSTLPFDQKKLQVYVIFYQAMPDGHLLPDLSQHKGSFEDTFLFWGNIMREPFSVDYLLPTPGALQPDKSVAGDYYGFVIGIYYDKVLQDARSEPTDLIRRIPLPSEIE
jgi:hypothetical protein